MSVHSLTCANIFTGASIACVGRAAPLMLNGFIQQFHDNVALHIILAYDNRDNRTNDTTADTINTRSLSAMQCNGCNLTICSTNCTQCITIVRITIY